MSDRQTDQMGIVVETVRGQLRPSGKSAKDMLGEGVEYVAGGVSLVEIRDEVIAPEELQRGIEAVCAAVAAALEKIAPESCSVEFGLGFKAGAKVPVLMSGEANASLKVTLTWKKAPALKSGT